MKKLSFTLFLVAVMGALSAQQANNGVGSTAYRFTLKEAEEFAARNNYQVQDKVLEVEKARSTIRETAAIGLPQIRSSFNYSHNAQIPQQPIPAQFFDPTAEEGEFITVGFGVDHQNQASLNLNQLIFDASYFVALRATRVFKETKALEQETAQIDARKNAAQAYYAVLVAEELTGVLRKDLQTSAENLLETQKLYENGFVEEQDVQQMQLLVNNLRNNLRNAERQVKLARQVFKFNLGLPLSAEVSFSQDLDALLAPEQFAGQLQAADFNYVNHIEYRTVLSQEKGAQLQLSNERSAYYPKLNGFVNHSQSSFANDFDQAFSFNTNWIPGTVIGANLSWNLFSGLSRAAKVQKARVDLQRLAVAKNSTASQLTMNYERAQSDFAFAMDNYRNQKQNARLSQSIFDKTTRKYQEGISSSLDLTQAQNQLLQAQRNYINALMDLLNAKEELENALGN